MRHIYLPTALITDNGSVFVSNVIHEMADILGITIRCATMKHAKTIGILERTHGTIKTSLKISPREFCKHWCKYLHLAFLNYETTYHTSIGSEPSSMFHGQLRYNILNQKVGLNFKTGLVPTTVFTDELLRRIQILYEKTKNIVMQSYLRYKKYNDNKSKASLLQEKDYCYILQLQTDHQGSNRPFATSDGMALI